MKFSNLFRYMDLNNLSSQTIKAAINVHKALGPGLLESVNQNYMIIELKNLNLGVQSEVPVPIIYRGQKIHEEGFRIDLLISERGLNWSDFSPQKIRPKDDLRELRELYRP